MSRRSRKSRLPGGGSRIPRWDLSDPGMNRSGMIPGSSAPSGLGGRSLMPSQYTLGRGPGGGGAGGGMMPSDYTWDEGGGGFVPSEYTLGRGPDGGGAGGGMMPSGYALDAGGGGFVPSQYTLGRRPGRAGGGGFDPRHYGLVPTGQYMGGDPGGAGAAMRLPGSSLSGAGHNPSTPAREPVESALSPELEAELREEAEDVFRELVGIGLDPAYARLAVNTSIDKFVREFKPGDPIADIGKRLERDIGPWVGRSLPDLGMRRMREQNIRAGRLPTEGWPRYWGPEYTGGTTGSTTGGGKGKPFTRAQCQAIDNIVGEGSDRLADHDRVADLVATLGPNPSPQLVQFAKTEDFFARARQRMPRELPQGPWGRGRVLHPEWRGGGIEDI